jgi:hypothetical protein
MTLVPVRPDWVKFCHLATSGYFLLNQFLPKTSSFHTWVVVGILSFQMWSDGDVFDFQIKL